jgi:prevent-host-death family protein
MERVSVLEFRRDAERIIRKVKQGQRLILTYRGRPVMRLEPIQDQKISSDDPFYGLAQLAVPGGKSLTNEEIDRLIYES